MRHSTIATAILSSLLVLFSIGCEEGDPFEKGNSESLTEFKQAKEATSCDFDRAPLTVGNTHSVTIKNGNLKPLKEKDLLKKGYLVKIDIEGDVDSFDATVETQGAMVVSLRPDKAGHGTVSVFTLDKKKGKETITASCSFEVTESLEDTDGDADSDAADQCPDDPHKTEPGVCGCGVADTNSDQDAKPDCQDGCPNDSSKVTPGECGCGVAEGTCGEGENNQGDGCREGVIDDSQGEAESRPACTQPYSWLSGRQDDYRDQCSLCTASTEVPYKIMDPAEENPWNNYGGRAIGSRPTTCTNAFFAAHSLHRMSQECSEFRDKYEGVCCGREEPCNYVATWYTDSPDLSCDDASAYGSCRCADDLSAPGNPDRKLIIPIYDFSATSPFAQAVRNKNICGVEIGTNPQFQTGQYETTCARFYEAARRGFTQKYECGYMKNVLRESCGSLAINP